MAEWGTGVDVNWAGADRNTRGDYVQAGDAALSYHIAKYGYGVFQLGMNVSYFGTGYAVGWCRIQLNLAATG